MPAPWTRERLESLIGQSETLVLEFKRHNALLPTDRQSEGDRFNEAARDVAAMANEAGGTLIYGIDEEEVDSARRAVGIGAGFGPGDNINRERFLQLMSTKIQPAIRQLEAYDVDLGQGRRALVVEVPQARERACQTQDGLFWRRGAQGRHKMSAQEIEDVRGRAVKPQLTAWRTQSDSAPKDHGAGWETHITFGVSNPSLATATFVVATIGVHDPFSLTWRLENTWAKPLPVPGWDIARVVIASGSSPQWSPITPGLSIGLPQVTLHIPRATDPSGTIHLVGILRLDHDGGSISYGVEIKRLAGYDVSLKPFPPDDEEWAPNIPSILWQPPSLQ